MFGRSIAYNQLRRFATSRIVSNTTTTTTTTNNSTLYAFKKQLDEFIYYHSLSSQWKPLVYRERNADELVSLNAVDKKNHPLVPLKYPGIPSKKKLIKFISLLLTPEEVKILRSSLDELFKIRISKDKKLKNNKYLEPSVINEFLYKSYELDKKLFTENLIWLDQINPEDSVWSVKNTEAVAFIRSMIIRSEFGINDKITFDSMLQKMKHWIKKSNMNENGSILYNSSLIIASIYSNSLKEHSTYLNILDKLTRNKVYTVKPNTDYLHYDHAYSILSALRDASKSANAENNEQLLTLVSRWDQFFKDVEYLKGKTPSTYEKFLNAEAEKITKAKQSKKDETETLKQEVEGDNESKA